MDEHYKIINLVVCAKDAQATQDRYKTWSHTYDETTFEKLGFSAPFHGAETLVETLGVGKDLSILDIGAGTGRVGHHLRTDFNFNGEIDLLDANMEMLLCASQKEHLKFRTIIKHFADEDGNLPVKDNSYDALMCIGSFLPNHIPPKTVQGFLKALKCGGVFIFNLRSEHTDEYNAEFEEIIKMLISEGKVTETRKQIRHFKNWGDSTSSLITLRKLK